ncbi:sigma factor [Arthrobacter sp. B1805]|uniref:sigma factor n=1 Tax=Arthrobacter sp. B1805 TaxID=2058892 RepID=UPI000CE579DA
MPDRSTRARVYGLVRRVLVDTELSAEVTQDVFLALLRTDAALYHPSRGNPMSWLMTLAHVRQSIRSAPRNPGTSGTCTGDCVTRMSTTTKLLKQ